VGVESLLTFNLHDVGVAEAEQVERTADGTGVNGLPEPIQDEHGMFK